jgi:hypothetical protein
MTVEENKGGFTFELTPSNEQNFEQPKTVELPDPVKSVPKIFCADKEVAKGLLIDLYAMIGTLKGMEDGVISQDVLPLVLENSQKILTQLTEILIRDCNITDSEIDEVMKVFAEVNKQHEEQREQ